MNEKATPRPWAVRHGFHGSYIERAENEQLLARMADVLSPECVEANADLIVTAVNAHEALVEACEDAVAALSRVIEFGGGLSADDPALAKLRAALAKAGR